MQSWKTHASLSRYMAMIHDIVGQDEETTSYLVLYAYVLCLYSYVSYI